MNYKVATIIPVYNGEKYLKLTIESALAQSIASYQVIIVDDGSTDRSVEIAESYLSDNVSLIRQENSWVGKARNVGAASANAEFLAFLDADDLWHPDKLQLQVDVFDRHPEIKYVGCNFGRIDSQSERIAGSLNAKPVDAVTEFKRTLLLKDRVSAFNSSTMMLRSSDYQLLDGFREDRYMRSLDYDFAIRASLLGPGYIIGQSLMDYRELANSMLHGDPTVEYEAQLTIFKLHREQFTNLQWRKRLSQTYVEWADTLLYNNSVDFKDIIRKSISLYPLKAQAYILLLKYYYKSIVGRDS